MQEFKSHQRMAQCLSNALLKLPRRENRNSIKAIRRMCSDMTLAGKLAELLGWHRGKQVEKLKVASVCLWSKDLQTRTPELLQTLSERKDHWLRWRPGASASFF